MITLDVPATGENPYAYIQRRFDVAPAELDLSFDFTAPVVPPLYAIVGCGLTFRPPEPSMARTELKFTVSDGTGPVLETVSVPGAGPKRSAPLDDPGSAFHSVALRVTVATDGRGNAHYRMGASEGDFDFLVREPSASVTLTCGSYADSAAGTYTFLVDNVRLGICKTRP